ncbi:MAG: beta-N-acetylhexosaminidase [Myxococcota bacterium]|nr:beta-N-acetylhexosaminidase [Myxococcota bacterium]
MDAADCGRLVVGGFEGTALPPRMARALQERQRGGVILFGRNVAGGPSEVAALLRQIHACSADTPLVGVDQEGGRVARMRAPLLVVPPMQTVASWGDPALAERIAGAVGAQLAALGFTIAFAPVLDVNTRPDNPIIGDRSFGAHPETCGRFGVAWIRGLQGSGLLACAKHFPGHGDTTTDSHLELPIVEHPRDRLDRVELSPFRAAAAAGVAAMMTAHVVFTAIDPALPATLSRAVCGVLRAQIGFGGMIVSDDLEMQAISARWSIEDAAVLAVAAGCDVLLVCSSEEKQERAVEAIAREAESSTSFRVRCAEAVSRVASAMRGASARPQDDAVIARALDGNEARALSAEMDRRRWCR